VSTKESLTPPRPSHTERRLAAILHADAYGYSRLINEDESGTLRVLTPALALLRDVVQHHGGHSVGSRGDSLLAEFPSVVAAVQCAIEMQHELQTKNTDLPETKRIAFRIGISLGEIVIDGEQPHGDGINIAVRIEGLAEPGEICLSEVVYQQVKNKLSLQYEDLGPQQLKNIPEPVRVYRIVLDEAAWAVVEAAQQTRRQSQRKDPPLRSRVRPMFVLVSVFVVLVAGIIAVRYFPFSTPSTQHLTPSTHAEAEAEACFLKAIEIAYKQQAKSLELRAVMSLAKLWQQQGKKAEAHRMLAEIYGWFTEGFDTKDWQEAKALLEGWS